MPQKEDEGIRKRMDAYNRVKMHTFKSVVDEKVVESRKRQVKAELKMANERVKQVQAKLDYGVGIP